MKARIKIEATVDVSKNDYRALEAASPLELVQTAQMQGARISASVERTRKPAEPKQEESAPEEEKDNDRS